MMEEYMDFGIQSALLTVLLDYSKNFIPLRLKVTLPNPLSKIFTSHLRGKPLSVYLAYQIQNDDYTLSILF
jgi:hypothetical protein